MLALHTVAGLLALATGLAVCVLAKGTRRHRRVGWVYAASMYALCLSSFAVPADLLVFVEVGGMPYGIFHVFGLWGTLQLTAGVGLMVGRARFEEPVKWHLYHMLWSFVGLVMATGSHFFRYVAPWLMEVFGLGVGWGLGLTGVLLWGVPAVVGTVAIERAKAHFPAADAAAVPAG